VARCLDGRPFLSNDLNEHGRDCKVTATNGESEREQKLHDTITSTLSFLGGMALIGGYVSVAARSRQETLTVDLREALDANVCQPWKSLPQLAEHVNDTIVGNQISCSNFSICVENGRVHTGDNDSFSVERFDSGIYEESRRQDNMWKHVIGQNSAAAIE